MSSTELPGFSSLFAMCSKGASREFIADIDLDGVDPYAATRGTVPVKRARAWWTMGAARPGTAVWTQLPGLVLFHSAMRDALSASAISGWSSFPAELRGRSNELLDGYAGLVVTGRCGPLQPGRSVRTTKEYPAGIFPVCRGLFFDESSWDGSDFFMPDDDTAWIFVTERARRVLQAKAENVLFENLRDIVLPWASDPREAES